MKKNIRNVPTTIRRKLTRINGSVVAGCAKVYWRQQVDDGLLEHLGIRMDNSGLVLPGATVPLPSQGKYSRRNVHGREIRRDNLPKETHYNSITSPNYGDWSKGSHTTDLPYEKYPRDFEPPHELEIIMQCQQPEPGRGSYAIAFQVAELLDPEDLDFEERLLYNLNLLQENTFTCGVEAATTVLAEYLGTLEVNWDILPPGSRDEALARLFVGRQPSAQEIDVANERLDFFVSLQPKQIVVGESGFRRYFGALLEDDLVVFENTRYGNAVYVLHGNWEELSQRSRMDLLSGRFGTSFARVIHRPGWEGQVRILVEAYRAADT